MNLVWKSPSVFYLMKICKPMKIQKNIHYWKKKQICCTLAMISNTIINVHNNSELYKQFYNKNIVIQYGNWDYLGDENFWKYILSQIIYNTSIT